MLEWQAGILAVQILILVAGWVLFQKARAELSARAAETPVLGEIRALHRNVKQMLAEIGSSASQVSERLEARCAEARELLVEIETRLETANLPTNSATKKRRATAPTKAKVLLVEPETDLEEFVEIDFTQAVLDAPEEKPTKRRAASAVKSRRQVVFTLADAGASQAEIARETGISEGEVETLLGLRVSGAN